MLLTTASNDEDSPSESRGLLVGCVQVPILDLAPMRASPVKHPLAEVDRKHLPPEVRHPARKLAVAARDIEDPLSRLELQQPFDPAGR